MHRVLVIDDNEDIRVITAMSLEVAGNMDVRTCGTGRDGLAVAREWNPSLVLLDVKMPDMDGPAVLEQLRASSMTCPVVFFTASVLDKDRGELLKLPIDGLIAKPFDPVTLPGEVLGYLPEQAPVESEAIAEPLSSLLYVSRSALAKDVSAEEEIEAILEVARVRNARLGVTGALVSTDAYFAQFLEGPAPALDRLMSDIEADPRHEELVIIPTAAYNRRLFDGWSMAYKGSSTFIQQLAREAASTRASAPAEKLIWLMREFTNPATSPQPEPAAA